MCISTTGDAFVAQLEVLFFLLYYTVCTIEIIVYDQKWIIMEDMGVKSQVIHIFGKISNFAQDGSFTGSMPISDLSASSCQCADVVSTTGGPASPPAGAFYPDFFFAWGNSSGVYCGGYPTNNVAQISSDGYASEGMYFV